MRRFRVLDIGTRWFWLVVFWRRQYGRPRVELSLYAGSRCRGQWFHALTWEDEPAEMGAESVPEPR